MWNTLSFFFSTAIIKCTLSHGFFTLLINIFIAKGLAVEIAITEQCTSGTAF